MLAALASPGQAQTVNPKGASFTASSDHAKVLPSGTKAVSNYVLDCMVSSPTGSAVFSKDLQKPAPDAANTISVSVPEFLTLSFNAYICTVSAIGPGGSSKSAPSDPFESVPAPGAPGKPIPK